MSYPAQPPQQPGGNPYAQNQPPQPGGNPYGQNQPPQGGPNQFPGGQFPPQQGQFGGGFPAPTPAPSRGNLGLGILAALVITLVAAGIYGAIMGAVEAEVGYAAVGVGFLIGFLAAKAGGASPAVIVVSAVLSLAAVYLGQILGLAIYISKSSPIGVMEILTQHFGDLSAGWKEELDFLSFVFLALGPIGAISGAKKAG
ncbi:hypothetical protein [Streptomyces sp. NPDC051561]|uniref:hypothetical protein n=1 Tax=Streptomyces sp. NPDC051561 TaxID=3365658 RepID=UPI00379299C6